MINLSFYLIRFYVTLYYRFRQRNLYTQSLNPSIVIFKNIGNFPLERSRGIINHWQRYPDSAVSNKRVIMLSVMFRHNCPEAN